MKLNNPMICKSNVKSLLYCTVDMGAVQNALQRGWRVLLVAETRPIPHPNCGLLSSLLPVPMVCEAYLNGRPDIGHNIYYDQLNSQQMDPVIATILASIMKPNSNLLLYVEPDPNKEFLILDTIGEFFHNSFGVNMGQYNHYDLPASLSENNTFNFNIADCLFRNGMISKEEYAFMIPPNFIPNPQSCALLLQSINFGLPNQQAVINLSCQILHDIREQVKTGKKSVISILSEQDIKNRQELIDKRVQNSLTRYGDKN